MLHPFSSPKLDAAENGWRSPWCWAFAGWVLVVLLTPVTATETLAIEAVLFCFAAGFYGIDPKVMFRRWLGMALTVVFLAYFVAIGHPSRQEFGWSTIMSGIVLKNGILLATVVSLVEKIGQFRLFSMIASMGLPRELVGTIGMMARYGPVLADQNRRMKRARQSRMIRRSVPGIWLVQSGGLATLLTISLRRSERIHAAMLARGWQSRSSAIQSVSSGDETDDDLDRDGEIGIVTLATDSNPQ